MTKFDPEKLNDKPEHYFEEIEQVDFFAVAPDREDEQISVKTPAVKPDGLWTDINAEEFDRILDRLTDLLTSAYVITYWTSLSSGETEEVEILYEHPTVGAGYDTCRVSVSEDAG